MAKGKGRWRRHRVHTEWQQTLTGVHSLMMEKWCTPTPPFTYQLNIKCKITVYLLLFHLYPYVLCVEEKGRRGLPL